MKNKTKQTKQVKETDRNGGSLPLLLPHKKMRLIPKESFSPESGGRVKARMAIEAMRIHGIIRLKKLRIYIYIQNPNLSYLYLFDKDIRNYQVEGAENLYLYLKSLCLYPY